MTLALDTNVLVRILADPASPQYPAAVELLSSAFTIPASVFMETEWVLRSAYRWPRACIATAFRDVIDLPHFTAKPDGLEWVIATFESGADYADMTHLSLAKGAAAFATFDAGLTVAAGADTPVPIETLR